MDTVRLKINGIDVEAPKNWPAAAIAYDGGLRNGQYVNRHVTLDD